jgi:hypothetical protein
MEMKFGKASNVGQLSQLHRPMQIIAKMVDDPVNSLSVVAYWDILSVGRPLRAWHRNIVP